MDLTVYGGHEPWEDSAAGWPRADLGFAAVYDEIDALAARARGHGAGQVEGPVDTPWNARDLATVDPDGNIVLFPAARPPGPSGYGVQ
jgi:hypothetical protein